MARRKDHTREELLDLAVDAAIILVREGGPGKLTARKVAEQIGYTPGTLYNVFSNLDELIARVNQRSMENLYLRFKSLENKNYSEQLKGVAKAYVGFYKEEPYLWELLFEYPIDHESEWYSDSIAKVFSQVIDMLRVKGDNETDARREAKVFWATLHGICSLHYADKLDVGIVDSVEVLIRKFLKGYFDV